MRSTSIALLALLLAACAAPMTPEEKERKTAEICKVYQGYLPSRNYSNVLEQCSQQLGEAECRKCLGPLR